MSYGMTTHPPPNQHGQGQGQYGQGQAQYGQGQAQYGQGQAQYGQGQGWQQSQGGGQRQQAYNQYYQGIGHGQPAPPASQHYGSYGQQFQQNVFSINAWQAIGFNSEGEFRHTFESRKSQRYNALQAEELLHILNQTPSIKNYYRINWSMELCKIMIAMLDRSHDGMMQYQEFTELLQCLTYWYQTFCQYDANRSGYIEATELGRCIKEKFGYTLSAKVMEAILKRYSRAMDDGRLLIAFDDFIALSVRLRAYTEAFRARDRQVHMGQETGQYPFGYDDFLQCTLCL